MRKVMLKKLAISNFKGIASKEIEFGKNTLISGANGVGKSTIYNAVLWVLFDKDANGNGAVDVRPHDDNGTEVNDIEIRVDATFDVDGREITLTKTQKQNWVKDRTTKEQVFKGNDNVFEINGIPKKAKDFKEYVSENFCEEDVFLACTNATSFFKLDTKKRRAKLLQLAGTVTNEDVIKSEKRFGELSVLLKDGTVDELITRSKGTIKRLNDELKVIPARIDEQSNSKVDVDVAEIELEKSAITNELKKADKVEKLQSEILELKFDLSEIQMKANESLQKERSEFSTKIYELAGERNKIANSKRNLLAEVDRLKEEIAYMEDCIAEATKSLDEAYSRKFDTSTTVCPTCGQTYPEKKQVQLKASFDSKKKEDVQYWLNNQTKWKEKLEIANNSVKDIEQEIKEADAELKALDKEISKLEKKLDAMPSTKDVSGLKKYQSISSKIAEKQAEIDSVDMEEMDSLRDKLNECNAKLAVSQRNIAIDERIEELTEQKRSIAQKIANEERMLDLLADFSKARMEMLTESVNKHFKLVKFRLFSSLINGGYADVCQVVVNGSNYETVLNHGHRILADLDILQAFQSMNGLQLPIFLDDTESVDSWRIPETKGQLIMLRRTDDKKLMVSEV